MRRVSIPAGIVLFTLASLLYSAVPSLAQSPGANTGVAASDTVVAGPEYAAGSLHRFFFGDLWRDAWTAPVRMPYLDLASYGGGLTPLHRGGGMQTASLRLKGGDGREYKFRSLNKDPSKTLEEKLRDTFVDDILQDLISTAHPYGALAASPILKSTGTLHAPPTLCIMPDSPALGEFRKEFGGMPGMIELHPDEIDKERGFAGSDKVVGTFSLLDKVQHDTEDRVQSVEFLKARIIDIFMGDWDRHTDQWRWARYEEGELDWWYPIPRDRDQAFCQYDGLIPWLATVLIPQLESCDEDYPGMQYLTYSGRHLDRRFLSGVPWSAYDSLVTYLLPLLSDEVLQESIDAFPKGLPEEGGNVLYHRLQSRRAQLRDAIRDYYEVLALDVDIYGSDEDEMLEVTRHADGSVEVIGRSRNKLERPPFFHRSFFPDETSELRIYLEGGDDVAIVRGHAPRGIIVRVIGGHGRDTFIDSSRVGALPLFRSQTCFYDHGDNSSFTYGSGTLIDRTHVREAKTKEERYEPPQRDWGWELLPGVMAGYNDDLGILIGGGPVFTRYGFRSDPYDYRLSLLAGFAPLEMLGKAELTADFRRVIAGHSFTLSAGYSGYEVLNFFGLGNRTKVDRGAEYSYAVKQTQLHFSPAVHFFLSKYVTLSAGFGFRYVTNDRDDETLYLSLVEPLGTENTSLAHVEAGLCYDSRDSEAWPSSGVFSDVRVRYYPAMLDLVSRFETVNADLRAYLPVDFITEWTLAFRAGGQYNHGKHPFFESAFLGGLSSARGYELNRFAGDAAMYGGVEWRGLLGNSSFIVPTDIGALLFVETGRVFLEEEQNHDIWHPSWGGGLWFAPVHRAYTFSASIGLSHETTRLDVAAGFAF
ncbi:outer membrane protein assembly factor [bacterium]|nr:outer membrane protein assembly factor [bacterium]